MWYVIQHSLYPYDILVILIIGLRMVVHCFLMFLQDVPMKFARSNGLVNRNCESVVMDENRRLWPTSICSTSARVRIRGLKDIWAANGLEEGDEFFLELVDNGMKHLIHFHGNLSLALCLCSLAFDFVLWGLILQRVIYGTQSIDHQTY